MPSRRERAFVPVLVFDGLVISIISSLGAPLIPTLATDLHTSLSNAQWSLTATLVVGAVASPLVGRLGDGRHRRTVILTCLAIVVAGGILAALATSLFVLIAGRAMQGVGLALLPLTMACARDHLPAVRSASVIALLSVSTAAGVGLGYPLTGLIADQVSVAAAFWFGAIVAALAFAASFFAIPNPRAAAARRPLDLSGALIIGAGLVALLIGLEQAPEWGWGAPRTLVAVAAGLGLLGVWARHELRIDDPLVDLRLARHRSVLTANVTGMTLGVTMYMSLVLLTTFVQLPGFGLGESVFVGGLILLPMSILSFAASRTLLAAEARIGARPIIPAGALAIGASMVFFAATTSALLQMFVAMGMIGLGLGYTFAAIPGLIVGAIPRGETGSAMGFYQVSRYVGFALGSALCVTLLDAFAGGGAPTLASYRATALVAAGLAVVAAIVAWILPGRPASVPAEPLDADLAFDEGIVASAGLEMIEEPV